MQGAGLVGSSLGRGGGGHLKHGWNQHGGMYGRKKAKPLLLRDSNDGGGGRKLGCPGTLEKEAAGAFPVRADIWALCAQQVLLPSQSQFPPFILGSLSALAAPPALL